MFKNTYRGTASRRVFRSLNDVEVKGISSWWWQNCVWKDRAGSTIMAKDAVSGLTKASASKMAPGFPMKPSGGTTTKLVRVTERLEEDAKEMEDRLIQLKMSMLEEKKKRDKELPLKHGGSRWRSAREDRGSVSKYAQDIQKKNGEGGNSRKSSSSKSNKKREEAKSTADASTRKKKSRKGGDSDDSVGGILSMAAAPKWTTNQVLEWLAAIGLDEYQSGFEYHQITGATLLELTLDEYTQIGVSKLSTRNILSTEVDKIREAIRAHKNAEPQNRVRHQPTEIIDPKLRDVTPEMPSPESRGAIHWSHVKPLSETTVAMGNGEVPVNLADGEFDEDASHASFMKALLEWRTSDAEPSDANTGKGDDDGLWVNPMMSFQEEEEVEHHGGALLEGSYEEAKEQEAFRRAVEAWRSGASTVQDTLALEKSAARVEKIEQGCTPNQRKSCWQCYRVVDVDSLLVDAQTKKPFCSSDCQSVYRQEYSRFYQKQQ